MTEHVITYQDEFGVRRTMILDTENPGQIVVKTEQVLDEVLAGIARDRELHRKIGDVKTIARLPVEVYERMVREKWGPDDEARYLNSSDASQYRIWAGRLGRDR